MIYSLCFVCPTQLRERSKVIVHFAEVADCLLGFIHESDSSCKGLYFTDNEGVAIAVEANFHFVVKVKVFSFVEDTFFHFLVLSVFVFTQLRERSKANR